VNDYEHYDLTENDPYRIPGSTCLVNLLDLTDTESLNQAEKEFTKIRLAGLPNSSRLRKLIALYTARAVRVF
jgi:cell filamentation protein